jgi:hypothetical protein
MKEYMITMQSGSRYFIESNLPLSNLGGNIGLDRQWLIKETVTINCKFIQSICEVVEGQPSEVLHDLNT